jgi:hypothetical protein
MPTDALDRSLGEPLPDLLAIHPAVSPHVAAAVMAAMAVYPDQRTPTVGDFRKALSGQAVLARPLNRAVVQPAAAVPPRVSRPPGRPGSEPPGSRVPAPDPDPEVAGPHRPSSFPWLYAVLVASVLAVFAGVLWVGMQGLGARQGVALLPATIAATAPVTSMVAGVDQPVEAGRASPTAISFTQPTRTAGLPAAAPTRTLPPTEPPPPTRTSLPPPPTETVPQRPGRITQIMFCDRPCDQKGAVQTQRFPERVTEIFFAFYYENMLPGTRYVRTWANQDAGEEWVRYECTWQGPPEGVYYGRLWDVEGLRSGTWIVSIEIDGQSPFREVLFVEGSYDLWTPAGVRPCSDW